MSWTSEEVQQALEQVKDKASDADFRKLCVTDAHAAIKAATGKEIPGSFKIQFVDQQAAHVTFVLPPIASDELSEMELEQVAGGSKSGAENFFNGFGAGLTGGQAGSVKGDEGIAGAVMGGMVYIAAKV